MANVMAVSKDGVEQVRGRKKVTYDVTLSGDYAQAVRGDNTGEVLIPNSATNGAFLPDADWGLTGPERAEVVNGPAGLGAEMVPGADNFHWLLQLFDPLTGAELAAGAYAALNTGDLDFKVRFEGKATD